MTNFEKYKNGILEAIEDGGEFAVIKATNKVVRCADIALCEKCLFSSKFNNNDACPKNRVKWMYEEVEEYELSISESILIRALYQYGGYILRHEKHGIAWTPNKPGENGDTVTCYGLTTPLVKALVGDDVNFSFVTDKPVAVSKICEGEKRRKNRGE